MMSRPALTVMRKALVQDDVAPDPEETLRQKKKNEEQDALTQDEGGDPNEEEPGAGDSYGPDTAGKNRQRERSARRMGTELKGTRCP
jgi:hypothetical protein